MFRIISFILFLISILTLFVFYLYLRYFSIQSFSPKLYQIKDENQVFVSTNVGLFVGNRVEYQKTNVSVFLGIPYALPPIGSLRFKRPVPLPESNNKFEANHWPNPCLQKDNHLRLNNYNFSEDCLYLNVWTPAINKSESKPVVVHIHTGAFLFGSASESTYNGLVLSALGDVIVVTFNYRLNLYGFLYTGTDDVSVNAGMYDQVLALEWVSNYISDFGGDRNRMTLLGQSTGALAVGLHILSPVTNNLFRSAVMLSGSPVQQSWLSEPQIAKEFWLKYSKEVNCIEDEESITGSVVQCLSQLHRSYLPEMTDCKRYSVDPFVVSAPVVFDNRFKLNQTMKSLINGNISTLIGYTDDEGSWMLALEDDLKYGPKSVQNMSFSEAKTELKRLIAKLKSNTNNEINAESIANYYFDKIDENKRNDTNLLSRTIGIALGDHYIGCPAHIFAESMINDSSTVYQYYWTYKGYAKTSSFWTTFEEVWCGKWMGSCHSFELYAVFGIPFQQTIAFSDIDRRISKKMIKIVSNFAYNNKPLTTDEWSAYHFVEQNIVKPFYRIDYDLDYEERIGNNLRQYECDSLWKESLIDQ